MFEDEFLNVQNIQFIMEMYANYLRDKNSITVEWKNFFEKYNQEKLEDIVLQLQGPIWPAVKEDTSRTYGKAIEPIASGSNQVETIVKELISLYKRYGHLGSDINPLSSIKKTQNHFLINKMEERLKNNMQNVVNGLDVNYGSKVEEIISTLKNVYNGKIGFEFDYIPDEDEKVWLERMLYQEYSTVVSKETKREIFEQIFVGEIFELYAHKKFIGAKRFSLEGGESYLAVMHAIIKYMTNNNGKNVVIGMAHRGRLSTLAHICDKPYYQLFYEFEGNVLMPEELGSGDVKYHMGYKSTRQIDQGSITVELMFNPSHLEAVNPVALGRARALQDSIIRKDINANNDKGSEEERLERKGDIRQAVLPILVHGDAAFMGQGVVAETFNMANTAAYNVGGTIHIVINNQIGFTADPLSTRSSLYCADIAKIISAPVIHVNGDDPEACYKASMIAIKYRHRFHKDIVIDIVCYRRHGHNESDEPAYTQPKMYSIIKNKKSVPTLYRDQLINDNILTKEESDNIEKTLISHLEAEAAKAKTFNPTIDNFTDNVENLLQTLNGFDVTLANNLDVEAFDRISRSITKIKDNFQPNPKVKKQFEARYNNYLEGNNIDWAMAELMAMAFLLKNNVYIRMTGQDIERGTFSQRHVILTDSDTGEKYNTLNGMKEVDSASATSEFYNSVLSEFGVVGFEYGYSINNTTTLVLWEAQFGDFSNGAMIIYDQFISSAKEKWGNCSNMVSLLPHAYEGQGSEHSSARLERFLQLCANDNLIVANCTTPANYFHLLCRQGLHIKNKPLIVMTPKSLLRSPQAVSRKEEFVEGQFQPLIGNVEKMSGKAKIIIVTSGKVYYDIAAAVAKNKNNVIAIIRIEQYYPFPKEELMDAISMNSGAQVVVWLQEEPQNMGAWTFIYPYLEKAVAESKLKIKSYIKEINSIAAETKHISIQQQGNIIYAGRKAAASPATGSHIRHHHDQAALIESCLKLAALYINV